MMTLLNPMMKRKTLCWEFGGSIRGNSRCIDAMCPGYVV